jgi:D-alanyl-D-alanine carboxypeptidase
MTFRLFRLLISTSLASAVALAPAVAAPRILVDAGSGEVLSHREAFQRFYPASLIKMMTAFVVFRAIEAGEITMLSPVKFSKLATQEPPSKMYYPTGTVLTFETALKILLVKSANDVAVAIAESLAGSLEAFSGRMNAEAKRIGMTGSNFVNPNGLPDDRQYTTAHDLAVLALAIRRDFPQYAALFGIEGIDVGKEVETNYNILIGRYPGADGMKTGFICASGFNLAGSATQSGRTLIAIVLGAESQKERAEVAAKMLQSGFTGTAQSSGLLSALQPYGENRDVAVDLTGQICTDEARKKRWDGRDVEGFITFDTSLISKMTRAPVAEKIVLGGATGPVSSANPNLMTFVDVPRPTPRPQMPNDAADAAAYVAGQAETGAPKPVDGPAEGENAAVKETVNDDLAEVVSPVAGELHPAFDVPRPTPRAAIVR